jgi:hypothetical protein
VLNDVVNEEDVDIMSTWKLTWPSAYQDIEASGCDTEIGLETLGDFGV